MVSHLFGCVSPIGKLTMNDNDNNAIETKSEKIVRWTASHKLHVLNQISKGLLLTEEAVKKYDLSLEELAEWRRNYDSLGIKGLHITKRAQVSNTYSSSGEGSRGSRGSRACTS